MLRHSLTKCGELSRIEPIGKRCPKCRAKVLVGNPSAIPLSVEKVFCVRTSLSSGDRKILPSRDPLAISFICDSAEATVMAERKDFVPKGLSHCLKGGKEFLVRGSRDSETLLDWVTLAHARFARHRTEKPATKAGQIRALWPDIEAALEGGQSMKSIRKWLEEDAGVTLGITSLTSYISRIRRRLAAKQRDAPTGQVVQPQTPPGLKFVRCDSGSGAPRTRSARSSQAGSVAAEVRHPQAP